MYFFIVETSPSYTSQPPSPSSVMEGHNLTLQWSYNLEGQSIFVAYISNDTGSSYRPSVAFRKINDTNTTVRSGLQKRISASISDSRASFTIFAVPKSASAEKYQLTIITASPHYVFVTSDKVEISVLSKYVSLF